MASTDGAGNMATETVSDMLANITLGDDSYTLADKICYLTGISKDGEANAFDGSVGVRVSALFVILITASFCTFFPVVARRSSWLRIPLYVYLFARYFGTGVIVATAFIHLLDPAYSAIGPNTCVGVTSGWDEYSWVPAICLLTIVVLFLVDFSARIYVERKYGFKDDHYTHDAENIITTTGGANTHIHMGHIHEHGHPQESASVQGATDPDVSGNTTASTNKRLMDSRPAAVVARSSSSSDDWSDYKLEEKLGEEGTEKTYLQQIAAFYILEFGVVFHSIIIGLNLAVSAYDDFKVLYVVLVFHQSFEGLGVGSRLSAIPFPRNRRHVPWILCAAYGLCTPIAIAIGLGVRQTYNPESFTAQVVSGVFDATSAGILIYTGLVELLAADFLFNPHRTRDPKRLTFMLGCVIAGATLMALLGKWA